MARITVEDCLELVPNRYELVMLATRRARQVYRGAETLVISKNKVIVTSLREIAKGLVKPEIFTPVEKEDAAALPH